MAIISNTSSGESIWSLSADDNAIYLSAASLFFQNSVVPADGFTYVVPTLHQFMLFDSVTVDGDLTLNGDLILLG